MLVRELPALGGFPDGAVEAGFLCSEDTLYFVDGDGSCPSEWRINMNHEVDDNWVEVSREQYEVALAAKNDGWIEWGGGECPVEKGTLVDVKYRNCKINKHVKAGVPDNGGSIDTVYAFSWYKIGAEYDIISYRLHQPQEEEHSETSEEDLNECIGQAPLPLWNGDGMTPPIGCVCELSWGGDKWLQCKIIFAGDEIVLVNLATREAAYHLSDVRFRPIRSESERKRDAMVNDMVETIFYYYGNPKGAEGYIGLAERIIEAIEVGKIPGVKLEG